MGRSLGEKIAAIYMLSSELESSQDRISKLKAFISTRDFLEVSSLRLRADEKLSEVLEGLVSETPARSLSRCGRFGQTAAGTPTPALARSNSSSISPPVALVCTASLLGVAAVLAIRHGRHSSPSYPGKLKRALSDQFRHELEAIQRDSDRG